MSDAARLATTVVRPVATDAQRLPAVLVRTPSAATFRLDPARVFARIVAESGYAVALQQCRGRGASEGVFTPFVDEARDGQETIEWIADQPWFDGKLALVGFGYSGFAAWAALSRAPERVSALAVAFAARDPYASFFPGGAFQLANALRFGLGIGEREMVAPRRLDLERGLAFQPVREADRVALRRVDWYRQWADHPTRDEFWEAIEPQLPSEPPAVLLIAGWHDPSLGPQLDDYSALARRTRENGAPPPELTVGPWPSLRRARFVRRSRGAGLAGTSLRAILAFLGRRLRGSPETPAPVRVFVRHHGWRDAEAWPAPATQERAFYLHSKGRANTLVGDGELREEPPSTSQAVDRFTYDPADPAPTCGGFAIGRSGGAVDQRAVESRSDVLCYTTAPLREDLQIAGRIRVVLFAASSSPDTDFTAKLVEVTPEGVAVNLSDGILRCRRRGKDTSPLWLEPDVPERLEIDLWATAARFPAGHRIRVEISSANFPRFDRNPNTRGEPERVGPEEGVPAQQTVLHDANHPSHLLLQLVPR